MSKARLPISAALKAILRRLHWQVKRQTEYVPLMKTLILFHMPHEKGAIFGWDVDLNIGFWSATS